MLQNFHRTEPGRNFHFENPVGQLRPIYYGDPPWLRLPSYASPRPLFVWLPDVLSRGPQQAQAFPRDSTSGSLSERPWSAAEVSWSAVFLKES